jgi:hypothetical protein
MMISVAIAIRNSTSSAENPRGSRALTLRTPNDWSWPSMATLRLETTPSPSSVGDGALLVGAARELLRGVGGLGDVAGDDQQRLDGAVGGMHRHGLDGEREPVAHELEGTPLARQPGPVVLQAELQHLVRDLGVQLGHLAAAEHVGAEIAEALDRLAVGDQDPQILIEEEDARVGQVAGQRPVQRLRVADQLLGLVAGGGLGALGADVAEDDDPARPLRHRDR